MDRVLLFDLDGTLLPMDTDKFIEAYFYKIAESLAEHINPKLLTESIWKGTQAMLTNLDESLTNEQVFTKVFLEEIKLKKEDIWPLFDQFYQETFPVLEPLTKANQIVRDLIEEAKKQGYMIVIATNPVFPKLAIEHRLKWAGLGDQAFELVTVYEESPYTKPHKQYYEWICNTIGVSPGQCMMIGNDMQEDMVAAELGMKTFLVEDHLIDRGKPSYSPDARGTLEELYQQLKNREGIFN